MVVEGVAGNALMCVEKCGEKRGGRKAIINLAPSPYGYFASREAVSTRRTNSRR